MKLQEHKNQKHLILAKRIMSPRMSKLICFDMKLATYNINQSKIERLKVVCRVYLFSLFMLVVESRSEQEHTVDYGFIIAIREV